MGFKEWDLVEQLWSYFIDGISQLCSEPIASFQFPDQPFVVTMKKEGKHNLRLSLNGKEFLFKLSEFILPMLFSATVFYENLLQLFPQNEAFIAESLDEIANIKTKWLLRF